MRGLLIKVLLPIGLLFLSIGLAIATKKWLVTLTPGEEITVAVVLFTAGLALESVITMDLLANKRVADLQSWEIRNKGDCPLQNIRAMFARLTEKKYSDTDLFLDYFVRQFQEIEHTIRDAAEKDELSVRSHHFESVDCVLSAFSGEPNPVHKYTWVIEPGERLFPDEAGTKYFQLVEQMVRKRQISEVRALLIVDDLATLSRS